MTSESSGPGGKGVCTGAVRERVNHERPDAIDAREERVEAREVAVESREDAVDRILVAAEQRDHRATARDAAANRRDLDKSIDEYLDDPPDTAALQARSYAALDRTESRADRAASKVDRTTLAENCPPSHGKGAD